MQTICMLNNCSTLLKLKPEYVYHQYDNYHFISTFLHYIICEFGIY